VLEGGPHVEDEESTIPIGSRVSSAAGQGHDPASIITCNVPMCTWCKDTLGEVISQMIVRYTQRLEENKKVQCKSS
jgi:hypothetical protein